MGIPDHAGSGPTRVGGPKVGGPKVGGPKVGGLKVGGLKVGGLKVGGLKVGGPRAEEAGPVKQALRCPSVADPRVVGRGLHLIVALAKPGSPTDVS